MTADFFLKKESFSISNRENFVDSVKGLMELGAELKELEDKYSLHSETFYSFTTPLGTISNLLWGKNEILERDIKRLFQLFTDRAKKLRRDCLRCEHIRNETENDHVGFIGLSFEKCSLDRNYEVSNLSELLKFHRNYLSSHPPAKNEFREVIQKYFPNIYFHKDISSTLNGLKYRYDSIFKTILLHLKIINDRFFDLFNQHKNQGASKVCELLKPELPSIIEISRDRRNIDNLSYIFENRFGQNRNLDCHLHTKFKGYLEGNCHQKDHGDRIYFRHPDSDFHGGKILLVRIGKHS